LVQTEEWFVERLRLLGVVVVALLAATESLGQRTDLPVRGVNIHTASGAEMNDVVRMNLNWVRIDVNWAEIEATKGVYDWQGSWLEGAIDAAMTRGLKIYANVGTTPLWACRSGSVPRPSCVPSDPADWERFVRVLATRYRGLIDVYGIWNEPNVGYFWQGDALEYVMYILEPAGRTIREVDPGARIAGADLSSTTSPRISSRAFFDAIANRKASDFVDVVSWHVYEEGGGGLCGGFDGPDGLYKRFFNGSFCDRSQVYEVDRSTVKDRPIFLTETGFGNGGEQSASVLRLFDVFLPASRIDGLFFYELMDNSGSTTGLLRKDGTWKAGAVALSLRGRPAGELALPMMRESFDAPWMPKLFRWYVSSAHHRVQGQALVNTVKDFRAKVKDLALANLEITAKVQMTDDLRWPWNWVGITARTRTAEDGFRDSGYVLFLRSNGGLGLFRAPDTLLEYVETGIDPKESPVELKLRAERDFLTVFVNGQEFMRVQDGTYSSGFVGVQHYSLARTQEVVVRELP
jgi:hypothetical protein